MVKLLKKRPKATILQFNWIEPFERREKRCPKSSAFEPRQIFLQ
jgi:hypothetical protein